MDGLALLGADAATSSSLMKGTTLRATMLYPTSTATTGASRPAGATLLVDYSAPIADGRRKVNLTAGGSDYWVPQHDVAPVLDITNPARPEAPYVDYGPPAPKPVVAAPEQPYVDYGPPAPAPAPEFYVDYGPPAPVKRASRTDPNLWKYVLGVGAGVATLAALVAALLLRKGR